MLLTGILAKNEKIGTRDTLTIVIVNHTILFSTQPSTNRYDSYEPPNVKQELIAAFEEWKLPVLD